MKVPTLKNDDTVWRTPHSLCPACKAARLHTDSELALYHPFSKHGFERGRWTHTELDPPARADCGEL